MNNFSTRLNTTRGNFTFYFNAIQEDDLFYYHISFVDDDHKLQEVVMMETEGAWTIAHRKLVPFWILVLEEKLTGHITESLQAVEAAHSFA